MITFFRRANKADLGSYVSGTRSYPGRFSNYENIDMNGCVEPFFEFPIIQGSRFGDREKDSCEQGGERVIVNGCGETCAVVTHKGARNRNDFVPCIYHR